MKPNPILSRRGFFRWPFTALLVVPATLTIFIPQKTADLVILNAHVLTMDAQHEAQAFAVREGQFLAVGTNREMAVFTGPNTKVWDLGGKTVTPGFNDVHLHPSPVVAQDSPAAVVPLGPESVKNVDELVAALKRKAAITPKGEVIRGRGFQDTKLGRFPTRYDLDKATTEHPIVIVHSSGHLSIVNSLALTLSNITKATPDPAGGAVGKDDKGEPDGYLAESARGLLRFPEGARESSRLTPEQTRTGYALALRQYAAKGITSIGIAGTGISTVKLLRDLNAHGELAVRANVLLSQSSLEEAIANRRKGDNGDAMVRLGSVKIFHGNSFSGRTCWLYEPYPGRPNFYGVPPARSQSDLDELVYKIHHAGLQVCCHSNGDREIDMVLNAMEKAQARDPRPDARHRIEHGSVANPQILARMKKLGVIAVFHSYEWEHGDKMIAFGKKREPFLAANKNALEMGIPVAGHSDAPVSAADPMLRVQSMVTRTSAEGITVGKEQRVTPIQALRVWTMGGAYTTWEENTKGSIAVGKLADFVILTADPTKAKADDIRKIAVEKTVVGGKTVYDRTTDEKMLSAYVPLDEHDCDAAHESPLASRVAAMRRR